MPIPGEFNPDFVVSSTKNTYKDTSGAALKASVVSHLNNVLHHGVGSTHVFHGMNSSILQHDAWKVTENLKTTNLRTTPLSPTLLSLLAVERRLQAQRAAPNQPPRLGYLQADEPHPRRLFKVLLPCCGGLFIATVVIVFIQVIVYRQEDR